MATQTMTRWELGKRVFAKFGKVPLSSNLALRPTDALMDVVLTHINGGIQEMVALSPASIFQAPRGSGELGGSHAMELSMETAAGGLGAVVTVDAGDYERLWLCYEGAAFVVDGDPRVHRFMREEDAGDDAPTQWRSPYVPYTEQDGEILQATVHFDTWALRSDEFGVREPVELIGKAGQRFGLVDGVGDLWEERVKQTGRPEMGWPDEFIVEPVMTATGETSLMRSWLRVNRWCPDVFTLAYRAQLISDQWVMADISSSDDAKAVNIPFGWEESVLIPIIIQRCVADMTFSNDAELKIDPRTRESLLSEHYRQYEAAMRIISTLHPRRQGAGQVIAVD